MNRITWNEPNGSWGIEGVKLHALPPKVYGALWKLMEYEKTGLNPEQVEEIDFKCRKED